MASQFALISLKKIYHFSFKNKKASQTIDWYLERIPNFRTLVEYCKLSKIRLNWLFLLWKGRVLSWSMAE